MMLRLLVAAILFCNHAFSAGKVEQFYSSFIRGISSGSCTSPSQTNSSLSCQKTGALQNISDVKNLTQNMMSTRLVELDKERNLCSKSQWDSLKGNSPVAKEMKTARVEQMNIQLAQLQDIQNQLEKLGQEMNQGPSPAFLQQHRKYSKNKADVDRQIADAKTYQAEREEYAQSLLALFSQKMAEIPDSDSPAVAKLIQSKLSYSGKDNKPVTISDYNELVKSVSDGFQESIDDLAKSKSGDTYNLSIDEKARLATDPTLIAQLSREFQTSESVIENYQCEAKKHASTKENVELGANIASFAIPGGAFVLAKAARASFVLRSPKLASVIEKGSKTLGWASVGLGSAETAAQVAKNCLSSTKVQTQGSCTLNPKLVMEEYEMNSCIWDATLASIPGVIKAGTGVFAIKNSNGATRLSEFVAGMRKRHGRKLDYKFAGSLSDADRVKAAEATLGRPLTPAQKNALLEAHNMYPNRRLPSGSNDPLAYTEAMQKEKRDYLIKNGFGADEARLLGVIGITGNAPDPAIAKAIRQGSVHLFKKDLTPEQVQAVWDVSSKKSDDQMATLIKAGFTEDEAKNILNGKLNEAAKAGKDIVLTETTAPAPTPTVAAPKAAPTLADHQRTLADQFDRQNKEGIQKAFDDSRKAHLELLKADPNVYRKSPSKVIEGSSTGLTPKESADYIEGYIADTKGGDDGFKKIVNALDEKIAAEAKKSGFKADFDQYKHQELKVELLNRHYERKYKNKYNEIDEDRFFDEDEAGFEAYRAAREKLEQLQKKSSARWPK